MLKSAHKGFTLVELLVVISIIAILSVIGVTVFGGIQKNARDAKRKADIDAIAKAMEVHYGQCPANGNYCNVSDTYFASGSIPQDPLNGQGKCGLNAGSTTPDDYCGYCFLSAGEVDYLNNNQNNAHNGGCGTNFRSICGDQKYTGSSCNQFVICANLETPTGPPNSKFPGGTYAYCKFSQQ